MKFRSGDIYADEGAFPSSGMKICSPPIPKEVCSKLHSESSPFLNEPDRQANWLSAVQTIPGIRMIWGRHQQPEGADREEKQTDVNIAVELVIDGIDPDGCDHAVLVTADADLAPAGWAFARRAEEFSRRLNLPIHPRRLSLLLPPGQTGNGWRKYFEKRGADLEPVKITERMLAESLLQYEIKPTRVPLSVTFGNAA